MKKLTQTTILSAIAIAFLSQASAQTNTNTTATAHSFLNVNIALNGVAQKSETEVANVHLSTRDVTKAIIADAATNVSSKAKLLLRVPVGGGTNEAPAFILRDTVNKTNVDFAVPASILSASQVGQSVQSSKTDKGGATNGNSISIERFVFASSKGGFDVQGYTTGNLTNKGKKKNGLSGTVPKSASSKVSGNGTDDHGNAAVLQGTISFGGSKVE